MTICTKCGTLMDEKDANSHVCDPSDVPKKGEPIKFK